MSQTALLLVLAAAVLHAAWNYHLKKANSDRTFWLIVYAITAVVGVPAAWLCDPEGFSRITALGWCLIALSAPIHIGYALVLQIGYRKADYSIVYPTARGTGPLITVIAAVVILGNSPTLIGWLGIASILTGIVLLTARPGSGADASRVKSGILWGTLTGCFIASYSFCDAWAVQQATGLTPYTFYFPSIAFRTLLLAPVVFASQGWKQEMRRIFTDPVARKALGVVTIGSPGAYLLILVVLTFAPLAYVAPTREVGMMVGVIVGALLLREKLSRLRLCGIAAMVLGVVLIGLSK